MAVTRVEKKQRLHKRETGYAEVSASDGPPWSPDQVTWVKGRRSRPDRRGFPVWGGLGPEVYILEVA